MTAHTGTASVTVVEMQPQPPRPKSSRPFVIAAITGAVGVVPTFVLMTLALDYSGPGPLFIHLLGFALFAVWLACVAAVPVGLIGAIVRRAR